MSSINRNFLIYFVCFLCHETFLSVVQAGTTIILPENVLYKTNSTSATSATNSTTASVSYQGDIISNYTTTSKLSKSFKTSVPTTTTSFTTGRQAVMHVLQCIFQKDSRVQCFLDRAQRALDDQREKLLAQADAEVDQYYRLHHAGRASPDEKPSAVSSSVSNIITEITDMLSDSIGTFFTGKKVNNAKDIAAAIGSELAGTNDDEEEDDDGELDETETNSANAVQRTSKAARGHKKKKKKEKIHKLIALIKIFIAAAVAKAILDSILSLLSAHLQKKFLFIALAGLLINLARFWLDAKKAKTPQKIIYYEHAQHEHHYDTHEDHDHHHGSPSFWGRSISDGDTNLNDQSAHTIAYRAHITKSPQK